MDNQIAIRDVFADDIAALTKCPIDPVFHV